MEVSKVTFTDQTKNAIHSDLTRKQKTELRRQKVIDYIRSKPSGHMISMNDLIDAAGYSSENYKAGWQFVDTMVKAKKINKHRSLGDPLSHRCPYTIPTDVITKRNGVTIINPTYKDKMAHNREKREQVRLNRIIEICKFIDSKPEDTIISMSDMSRILSNPYASVGAIHGQVSKMIANGIISREVAGKTNNNVGWSLYSYKVEDRSYLDMDVVTYPEDKEDDLKPEEIADSLDNAPIEESGEDETLEQVLENERAKKAEMDSIKTVDDDYVDTKESDDNYRKVIHQRLISDAAKEHFDHINARPDIAKLEQIIEIEDLARDFAWRTGSDSLRDFIKDMK